MRTSTVKMDGSDIRVYYVNTVIVGSGAAGFNAADRLYSYGCTDIVLITEGINMGTSRNTGSDKQTYYKLTLSGGEPDSVEEMAKTLFEGHCVDGDIALCEAANSVSAFLKLCGLGMPFPTNRYGEYIGYKTDHDPRTRATSVGPLTSKKMTEVLEASVRSKDIPIIDNALAVSILKAEDGFEGLLCLDKSTKDRKDAYFGICAKNVIWATGGPAGIYENSVYPVGHNGMSGVPLEAGVLGKNLTEWQFGLASVRPRWNVSGTYMQSLPRFISTAQDGVSDEREFLNDFFSDPSEMLSMTFLKGYQWPFDVRKVRGGSSIIDILVYIECCLKKRRVFLDYRTNPCGRPVVFDSLQPQAKEYLEKAGACFGTPIERLLHMNAPAVEFYRSRGVDLEKEPLEVAVCAQHNNGGLDIDCWWQTNISGVFAAGEVAGSHGVYRPGGSALNAGQVGSMRAARYIAAKRQGKPDADAFELCLETELKKHHRLFDTIYTSEYNIDILWKQAREDMSLVGGPIRDTDAIPAAIGNAKERLLNFEKNARVSDIRGLANAYHYRDALVCQIAYLSAMLDYSKAGGLSRGSAMYRNPDGEKADASLPPLFTYRLDSGEKDNLIQLIRYKDGSCEASWRPVRPLPNEDIFFENVWRTYRTDGNTR